MNIELWDINRITPYEHNPRINDAAVDAVARSIEKFGFRQPIVVDRHGVIVVGHTRYKAALKLGLKQVPVHQALELTPEECKAYRVADNQLASIADWDPALLSLELKDLEALDFDMELLGFEDEDLARYMDGDLTDGLTDPDDVPLPPDDAITQPGDLWILGDHRLLCGDSSKPEDVDLLLGGQPIHLVNTDPPYNVKVEPRSNNAIAAGNSSFAAQPKSGPIISRSTWPGTPASRKGRRSRCGPRTDRWPTTSFRKRSSTDCSTPGLEMRHACSSPDAPS